MIGYFVIVITLLLLFYAIYNYGVSCNKSIENPIDTQDFLDLKTGDLVFVSYRNLLGNSIRVLSASEWSHVGMIYKDEISSSSDSLYILEVADYSDFDSSQTGVIKVPYNVWLNYNKHHKIGFRRLNEDVYNSIKTNVFSEFMKLKIYKQQKLTDVFAWKRLMFFEEYNEEELLLQEKITCMEFIVMLLQNLEIMEKSYKPSSYYPCDLLSKNILPDYKELQIL